ncbi:MAG TPA: biotin/lipoyl-containing protein [Terriglobia bacterium]|nr:biotin/lipoyl-containing protein [Terriglobia bacterium]
MIFEIEQHKEPEPSLHRVELPAGSGAEAAGAGKHFIIDGKPLEADWVEIAPGTYSILLDGRSYEARVAPASANSTGGLGAWVVTLAEHSFYLEARDPRSRRFAGRVSVQDGPQEIIAPMPGKIVRILVAQDEEVARDQGLLVIEAMKMQNELRAPRAGRVAELHVREGMGIEAGSRLLRLE